MKGQGMKKSTLIIVFAALFCTMAGCRREDVREMTVSIPGLTEANKAQVVEALAKCNAWMRSRIPDLDNIVI